MTREEAIERLDLCQNVCNDCLTCASHDEALDMAIAALRAEEGVAKLSEFLQEKLREQETVTNRNGLDWISVKDRLPEDLPENEGRKVIPCLVSLSSVYPNGKPTTQKRQRQLQYYGSAGWAWEWSRIGSSRVTHWMPLPEGPEVEI